MYKFFIAGRARKVAYGLGRKCYALGEYDTTDSLYNIFDKIFKNEKELETFLKSFK